MDKYLFIALTLGLTAYGQLIVKARALVHQPDASATKLDYLVAMYTDPLVLSALGAALLASVSWALALEKAGLGFAYPFMALSFVVVPVASRFLFGEPIVLLQAAGMAFILGGVALIALSAHI
jgi:drug/metabolite transporter (DMT)-like permease